MPPDNESGQVGVWHDAGVKDDFEELAYQRRTSMSEIARELINEEVEDAKKDGELTQRDEASAKR